MTAMRGQRSETSSTMWVERITTTFSPTLGQQIEEAVALLRVEARGRLVDDDQRRVPDQGLGDAEALAHAAGEAGERLLAHGPQIDLVQQRSTVSLRALPSPMPFSTARWSSMS